MKRVLGMILLSLMLLGLLPVTSSAENPVMASFYVSPSGSDTGTGSASDPFLTVEQAREAVRGINADMTGDIVVNLAAGRYALSDTLRFGPEDSGTNGYSVIYKGAGAKSSVLSGGTEVTGWTEGADGIWTAEAPALSMARDLYINEKPAQRARSQKMVTGVANYQDPDSYYASDVYSDGFYMNKAELGLFGNPEDIVFHWLVTWKDYQVRVADIVQDPDNENQVIVKMENPIWNSLYRSVHAEGTNTRLVPTYDKDFIVENALELLDEPGEFYFDKKLKKLYYYPRAGEDMQTAVTIVPQLDRVLRVDGRDPNHQAAYISFCDLGFAHTTNSMGDLYSQLNQQGEAPLTPQLGWGTTPGTVEVNWANHIDISDCSVWGTELVGISYRNGVTDSTVTGCSFIDTGSAAFMLGRTAHDYETPHANTTDAANVMYGKPWWGSYNYVAGGGSSMGMINPNKGAEFEYRYGSESAAVVARTWVNEPWAAAEGIKSWIICDLEEAYNLETIRLSFQEDSAGRTISDTEKSNFEVLLSNDKSFSEGSYVTAKTYTDPAAEVEEIDVSSIEGAYRYIMVRKTVAEPFAIFSIMAFSYDREPIGRQGLCKNITFENNYITGAARLHTQAPAVLVHHTDTAVIQNNEIKNVNYSGISLGWGWTTRNYTSRNNVIANNLVDGAMQATDDGGSVYILGNQSNLTISGNVFKNQGNMWGTLYFDSGAAGTSANTPIVARDNVVINGSHNVYFWNAYDESDTATDTVGDFSYAVGQVQVSNTYATAPGIDHAADDGWDGNDYFTCDDPILFTLDNPPEAVVSIMANAGLTAGYRHLRENERESVWLKGPEQSKSYHRTEGVSNRAQFYKTGSQNILTNAAVGTLPWQYAPEAYYELRTAYNNIMDDTNRVTNPSGGHILEQYAIKEAYEKANSTVVHPAYDEMVSLTESLLEGAVTEQALGAYPAEAITALTSALEAEITANPTTDEAQALAADRLENAVSAFCDARYEADLLYAYIEGGKTEVDAENRSTVITLPLGAALDNLTVDTLVSPGAALVTDVSGADFSQPVTLEIQHTASGLTASWTLTVVHEMPETFTHLAVGTDTEDWTYNNPNTELSLRGGELLLQPWYTPYMYEKSAETELSFRVYAAYPDTTEGFELLFGAHTAELEPEVKEEQNTGYRLTIKGQEMTFSHLEAGVTTTVKTADNIGFAYGAYNDVRLINDNGQLVVYVNNTEVLRGILKSHTAFTGYSGIYTPNTRVKLMEGTTLANIAENKPAFASSWQWGNEAQRAVDGDMDSDYMSGISDYGHRFILDLEAAYPISAVEYLAKSGDSYGSDLSISLSNDPAFVSKTPVYAPAAEDAAPVYTELNLSDALSYYTMYNETSAQWEPGHTYKSGNNEHEFTDGDESTGLGGGHGADAVWVDFGATRRLDKLDFVLYDEWRTSENIMFYATNENPDIALADGSLAAWTPLGEAFTGGETKTKYTGSFTLPAGSAYRYIVCVNEGMDPSASDSTADPVGEGKTFQSTLTEIKVYMKDSLPTLSGSSSVRLTPADTVTPYRYVIVEKPAGTGALGISDIRILVPESEAAAAADSVPADCISKGQPVTAYGDEATAAHLTSMSVNEVYTQTAGEGTEVYAFIDLGRRMPLDYIALSSHLPVGTADDAAAQAYRQNFKLIATNDPAFAPKNDVELSHEEAAVSAEGLLLYPLSGDVGSYRYVGVRGLAVSGADTRLRLHQLDVYTKSDAFTECLLPVAVEETDTAVSVTVSGISHRSGDYRLLVAYYDDADRLITAKAEAVTVAEPGAYLTVNKSFPLPAKAGTVKAFLLDSLSTVVPLAIEGELAVTVN